MKRKTCYLIKDDFDQSSVCVVEAENENTALQLAKQEYGEMFDGDPYAVRLDLISEVSK